MKIKEKENRSERKVLMAMIVQDRVLAHIADKWTREGMFESRWSNTIAHWCVEYYKKYGNAPGSAIENLYESWAGQSEDEESVSMIGSFLKGLSSEYVSQADRINVRHTLDLAGDLFNRIRIEKLVKKVQGHLDRAQTTEAVNLLTNHQTVEMGTGAGVDVLQDETAFRTAFEEKSDPLIRYSGALGDFFGDSLERDGFIGLMAPEKRGKTWWLLELAWQAMKQKRKVAFFSVGDMSQNQILRRWAIRAAKRPLNPKTVKIPTLIIPPEEESIATVQFNEIVYDQPLEWQAAWKSLQRLSKKRGDCLKLSTHPNSSISVTGISAILQQWEVEKDWKADVVIIDYADILAPENEKDESRDAINKTWKYLRRLSQEKHILVITATQADADSYSQFIMARKNFSGDKRKYAHVTGMLGINATDAEKVDGLCRLNWLVLRENEFSEDTCVHVAGCLGIGQPAILSSF